MALGCQVVYFVGLDLLNDTHEVCRIRKISVMENETKIFLMGILVQMIDSLGVEKRRASFDAVHFISLCQQQLRQIGAVLSGNPGYQGFLGQSISLLHMNSLNR